VYLDLSSGGPRLQAVIERLKSIGPVLRLGICKVGGHAQLRGPGLGCMAAWPGLHAGWGSACVVRRLGVQGVVGSETHPQSDLGPMPRSIVRKYFDSKCTVLPPSQQ
jgi:hypothetical protein